MFESEGTKMSECRHEFRELMAKSRETEAWLKEVQHGE